MSVYESEAEANQRLNNAVFMYNKEPVFCQGAFNHPDDGDLYLKLLFIPRLAEEARVKITDPLIEIKCLPQGYVNTQFGASYMARLPAVGNYKQGYDQNNISMSMYDPDDRYSGTPPWDGLLRSTGLRDMFQGKYPTVEEAVERLTNPRDETPASVAFHRLFALRRDKRRKDFLLDYKGEWIAFGSGKDFQLPNEFDYMRRQLAKHGIKVA